MTGEAGDAERARHLFTALLPITFGARTTRANRMDLAFRTGKDQK
jgi:hypothetical protein